MNKKLRTLLQRKDALVKQARDINANETLTDEQQNEIDALLSDLDGLNASIERERTLIEAERSMAGLEINEDAVITGGEPQILKDDKRGFKSFGEFAKSVANVSTAHVMDQRLNIGAAAPSTYGNEGSGADGGFLVPPEFGREIWGMSLEDDSLVKLTDNMTIAGNSMVFPSDETTPWGTDGIRAYWESEASAATATKPKLKNVSMRLNKLLALVPVSEELLSDASGLPSYLNKKVAESIRYKTNDALVNGTGAGTPEGILNAASLVTQAKEGSQTADTINANNVVKMFSRLIGPGRGVWLVNPDAYPQLPLMTIGDQPVYIAPNGLAGSPGGTLLGRPVILTDTCQTVGDLGDIYFVNFGMYRTLTKAGGIETATSMHLYFDAAAMAFRAIFRIAGQSVLSSAVTPPNSSVTRSGAVALAARA